MVAHPDQRVVPRSGSSNSKMSTRTATRSLAGSEKPSSSSKLRCKASPSGTSCTAAANANEDSSRCTRSAIHIPHLRDDLRQPASELFSAKSRLPPALRRRRRRNDRTTSDGSLRGCQRYLAQGLRLIFKPTTRRRPVTNRCRREFLDRQLCADDVGNGHEQNHGFGVAVVGSRVCRGPAGSDRNVCEPGGDVAWRTGGVRRCCETRVRQVARPTR